MQLTHEVRYILSSKKVRFESKNYTLETKKTSETKDSNGQDKWTPEPGHPWILTKEKIERMYKITDMRNLGMTPEQIDKALSAQDSKAK